MSIDFATLQGLTIPEGVVTQIADAAGVVLWAMETNKPVILEVEKITSDTYAGETTYTGEEFILLEIYPKTNGTVNVTYGGLTKTITDTSGAEEPNAQQVFFGTLYGVSDSVTTPTSGTLTIEGDYAAFACGYFTYNAKSATKTCCCVTGIVDFGSVRYIPVGAFGGYSDGCKKITSLNFPSSLESIESNAFGSCTGLTSITIEKNVKSIGAGCFIYCSNLTSVTFKNQSGWYVAETADAASGTAVDVTDPIANATLLTDTYKDYYWQQSV